jgi:hypothetical protein
MPRTREDLSTHLTEQRVPSHIGIPTEKRRTGFPASSPQRSRLEADDSYPVPLGQTIVGGDTWLIVGIVGSGGGATTKPYKDEHGSRTRPNGWLSLHCPTYLQSSSAASYNIYPRMTLYHAGAPAARSTIYAMTPTCVTSFRWNAAE